jgi:hypothetical protein
VSEWKEYDQEELVAYFRNIVEDEIVWNRARKVDWIFNERPPGELGEVAEEEMGEEEVELEDSERLKKTATDKPEPRKDGPDGEVL